jgi:hypothetical protein
MMINAFAPVDGGFGTGSGAAWLTLVKVANIAIKAI